MKTTMAAAALFLSVAIPLAVPGGVLAADGELFLYPVFDNGKIGYIDNAGKVVIGPRFDFGGFFYEGMAAVRTGGKYGYIDGKGTVVIEPRFDDAGYFQDGLAPVNVKLPPPGRPEGLWGYVDRTGRLVVEPKFAFALPFSEGLASVLLGDKWGFIDNTGRFRLEPQFAFASGFSGRRAMVKIRDRWGFIEPTGKLVIEPRFLMVKPFSEGLAPVQDALNGLWGYVDRSGKVVIKHDFALAQEFQDGLAPVFFPSREWAYIDPSGKKPFPVKGMPGPFSEGLAPLEKDGKFGFIDREGRLVIGHRFDQTTGFFRGLAPVRNQSGAGYTMGYIDRSGEYVWGPK